MSGTSVMMEFTWLKRKMNNPSPRSHVQNHPKRGSNPWVFLTPKLYQPTFGRGDSGYPTMKIHSRSYLLRLFSSRKNYTPENERLGAPEKSHHWRGKSSSKPSIVEFHVNFPGCIQHSERRMSWFHWSQLKSKRVAIFSICLPVLLVSVLLLRNPGSHRSQKYIQKSYHQSICRNK